MSSIHTIDNVFEDLRTVAVLGCSSTPHRTSHHIAKYLINSGYQVIPINPNEDSVLGQTCFDTVFDLPEDIEIDVIDIFRNKIYTEKMVREIVEWSKETGQQPVVWTQLDVSTDSAKELASENNLTYVENRCMMVEHKSFVGGLLR